MRYRYLRFNELHQLDEIWRNLPDRNKDMLNIGFIGNFSFNKYNLFHRLTILFSTFMIYRWIADRLKIEFFITYVAVLEDKILGFAIVRIHQFNGKYFDRYIGVFGVVISKKYWGQGVGTTLLKDILSLCNGFDVDMLKLTVDESNEHAIQLYENFGFKVASKKNNSIRMQKLVG